MPDPFKNKRLSIKKWGESLRHDAFHKKVFDDFHLYFSDSGKKSFIPRITMPPCHSLVAFITLDTIDEIPRCMPDIRNPRLRHACPELILHRCSLPSVLRDRARPSRICIVACSIKTRAYGIKYLIVWLDQKSEKPHATARRHARKFNDASLKKKKKKRRKKEICTSDAREHDNVSRQGERVKRADIEHTRPEIRKRGESRRLPRFKNESN